MLKKILLLTVIVGAANASAVMAAALNSGQIEAKAKWTAEDVPAIAGWFTSPQAAELFALADVRTGVDAHPEIATQLDVLFADAEMQALLASPRPRLMTQAAGAHFARWHATLNGILGRVTYTDGSDEKAAIVSMGKLCVFTLPDFPTYVIKLPIAEYPLGMSWGRRVQSDEAAPHQLISRVLAAQGVNKFIAEEGLGLVDPIKKWLYRTPGTPAQSDSAYAVVAERVLYNPDDQVVSLASLLADAGMSPTEMTDLMCGNGYSNRDFASSEHGELVEQIVQLITGEGLWSIYSKKDIAGANVKLYKDATGQMRAAFIDLERPAFGGSETRFFFHQSPQEVINNGLAGMNEFGPLLQDAYDKVHGPAAAAGGPSSDE